MASALPGDYSSTAIVRTEDELCEVVRAWLDELGCTYAELEDMWRTCDYATHRHRVAWVEIGGLGHLVKG